MPNLKPAATLLFLVFVVAPAALGASKKPAAGSASLRQAVVQVDGITNRVVDELWEATDHYWHDGDYNRIVGLVRVCVEADPAFFEAWGVGGWLLWSMGDTGAADAFLKNGLARNPGRWQLHYELGWHLFNTKRFADALPYLKKASAIPSAPAQAWKTLGHCYDKLGRLDEALATWRQVVRRFPRDATGPRNLRRLEEKKRAAASRTG